MYTQLENTKVSHQRSETQRGGRDRMRSDTNLGINIPNKKAARRTFMKTVIFSARGLLPMVMI
jgi:hypothetical protein